MQHRRSSCVAIVCCTLKVSVVGLAVMSPVDAGSQTIPSGGGHDAALYHAPKDGGVRRWRVVSGGDLRLSPSSTAAVVATHQPGAVLSNMGCRAEGRQVWCNVRPFRGGPRGFMLADQLEPAAGPDGSISMGADDSRHRAGRKDFDASGNVSCAPERGQSLRACSAAVARGDGGDATVVITFPNGFARKLYFVHGEFVSASATMSGVGRDTDWDLKDGVHRIRVDDQRFELPDALVFGD